MGEQMSLCRHLGCVLPFISDAAVLLQTETLSFFTSVSQDSRGKNVIKNYFIGPATVQKL